MTTNQIDNEKSVKMQCSTWVVCNDMPKEYSNLRDYQNKEQSISTIK